MSQNKGTTTGAPNILVVDDDRAVQQMLTDVLSERGYDVHTCRDGALVMGMLAAQTYDLMILDVLIPHINGFTLIEALRADPALRDLKVLMVSGIYRSRNHRAEMMERYGVVEYFDKPLSTDKLLVAVEKAVGAGAGADEHRRTTAPRPPGPVPLAAESSHTVSKVRQPSAGDDVMRRPAKKGAPPEPPAGALIDADSQREHDEVEQNARSGFRTSAFVLQGTLKKTPAAALLGRLWNEGVSGALLLRHGQVKKIVYLRGGNAYAVKSNRVSECLGQILVAERLISEVECEQSIAEMQKGGKRQGEVLVAMRAITEKNLRFALELQFETKLFDIFAWTDGEYRFSASAPLARADIDSEWKGAALIVEGIRRTYDETRLRSQMLPILDVPIAWRHGDTNVDKLRLGDKESAAVQKMKLPQTTLQLLDSMGLEPPEALRVVYSLIALQLLLPAT